MVTKIDKLYSRASKLAKCASCAQDWLAQAYSAWDHGDLVTAELLAQQAEEILDSGTQTQTD